MRGAKQAKPGEVGSSNQSTRLIQPEDDCPQAADSACQVDIEDTQRVPLKPDRQSPHQGHPCSVSLQLQHGISKLGQRLLRNSF
jgi:hypothetical protein